MAPPPAAGGGIADAVEGGTGHFRGPGVSRTGRVRPAGTPGRRGDTTQAGTGSMGDPDTPGIADRPDGRGGRHQPHDRRAVVPLPPHRPVPHVPHLPQARDYRARPAPGRLRGAELRVSVQKPRAAPAWMTGTARGFLEPAW